MTVLEKFIKQIVLKQVKGSVYLVPAICDFQITEALEEEKKQGQTLPIQIVSDLFSFFNYVNENYEYHDNTANGNIYFRKGDNRFIHHTEGMVYMCWKNNR